MVGEITPPPPRVWDFFAGVFAVIDQHDSPATPPCFDGTHEPSSPRTDNNHIRLHKIWLIQDREQSQGAILGLK
jgi:hypothetical protein